MKVAAKLADALLKSMGAEYLEDLFEVLQPDTTEKNNLGQLLPSRYIGGPSPASYTKLMSLYKLRGVEAVQRVQAIRDWNWYYHYSMEMYPEGAATLRNICGLDENELAECRLTPQVLKEWSKIKRGEDLFIKGLGKFNIPRACAHANGYRGIGVRRVQSYGYFHTDDATDMLKSKVWLPHIIRYYTQWKDYGFSHAGEFLRGDGIYDLIENKKYMNYGPEALYNRIDDYMRKLRAESDRIKGLPLDTPFPKPPNLSIAEGTMTPAKSGVDLVEWANAYKLCLHSKHYAEKGLAGHHSFWKVEVPGKPVAICQINNARKKIEQIRGYDNAAVPEQVRRLVIASLDAHN